MNAPARASSNPSSLKSPRSRLRIWPVVIGEAGLLVEARRPRALGAAVARLLDDHELNGDLRKEGPVQAQLFGWRAAGEALLSAYRVALRSLSKWS